MGALVDLDARREEAASLSTEVVEVFTLNGVTYTAPAKPPANLGLRFLDFREENGDDAAIQWLLRVMVGDAGWEALRDYEDLETTQLLAVFQACAELALGALEDPKDG